MKAKTGLAILLTLFASGVVFAHEVLPDPGLLPDSPFYFIKRAFEGVGTFFTFGAEAKAERYLELAERRLAESERLTDKAEPVLVSKTAAEYQKSVAKAEESVEKLSGDKKDALLQKIESALSVHVEVLKEVLEKVPEEAQEGVQNALEASQKSLDKFLEKIEVVPFKDEFPPAGAGPDEDFILGGDGELREELELILEKSQDLMETQPQSPY